MAGVLSTYVGSVKRRIFRSRLTLPLGESMANREVATECTAAIFIPPTLSETPWMGLVHPPLSSCPNAASCGDREKVLRSGLERADFSIKDSTFEFG